ncbi:MAG: hypothetical protein D6760_13530 [Deltaproteobacteria bacterium]|nr:MAG: hypothetical protein D6760_13530 [Deltaproteobacteria bacterium]
MPWVAEKDNAVTITHVIRDIDGSVHTASVSGLSVYIRDPSGDDRSSLASWTEPVSGGYVDITFTPDEVGNWIIEVTDPAGTDERTETYYTQCVLSKAGLTPSGTWLTTLANAKERLGLDSADTSHDTFLTNCIARASEQIEALLGRNVIQASYEEYHNGGGPRLYLRHGPIVSVTAVNSVLWSGGSPVLTAMGQDTYHPINTSADGSRLPGIIEADGWVFDYRPRGWRVDYAAGWSQVPYDIEEACLELVVAQFNRRKDAATTSRDVGSGGIAIKGYPEVIEAILTLLAPYTSGAVRT